MFEPILATLRTHLDDSDFFFRVDPTWSSREDGHRQLIRQEVAQAFSERGWPLPGYLMEPGTPPVLGDPPMSLSHCPLAGGFALTSPTKLTSLGFDIESTERVTVSVVSRISTPEEVNLAPDPASLWVAKEATYKALPRAIQPFVTSQIEIVGWLTLGQNFYRFNAGLKGSQHFRNASGVVVASDSLKMGFFVYPT